MQYADIVVPRGKYASSLAICQIFLRLQYFSMYDVLSVLHISLLFHFETPKLFLFHRLILHLL